MKPTSDVIVEAEEGNIVNGGAATGIGVLVAMVGFVLRIVIAADRVDRAKSRAQDARTRAALNRTRPSAPRVYPEPPKGVGYREPRPLINSPEALARFRDANPPGVTVSPPRRTPPRNTTATSSDRTPKTANPQDAIPADLLTAAVELVITTQFGSTAMLQRKLGITPTTAATVMDALESHRIVGPAKGRAVRDVLVPPTGLSTALTGIRSQPGS